eukprot:Gregarina_sp_Poly_1__10520@NODE_774_length_6341_cov_258_715014_g569_i0_p3_GENE_NODE_774_length_6341_cov_258_715014_g569_i0NODE_774_length_6341_cov_258_715014_g569_i0_p3_ORF_typecomplete_len155_score22_62HIT/PF01230_23/4_2e10HIT/PF01230_23/1_2e04CwfJ_C_1/PF04677_15/0_0013CwfJ_C_1/PF04677_15/2_3e03DcpS_C/PF11969_8/0_043DcpS_C/PF11969_8/6_1e02_NODE_774_length_6341_cov_258_715014_g569_i043544818
MTRNQHALAVLKFDSALCLPVADPLNDGHVIVVPESPISSLEEIPVSILAKLWTAARETAKFIAQYYLHNEETSFTYHLSNLYSDNTTKSNTVYIHVIPRKAEDFVPNDRIYDPLNKFCYYELARAKNEPFTDAQIEAMEEYRKKLASALPTES